MRFVAPSPIKVNLRDPIEEPDPYHPRRNLVTRVGVDAQFRTGDFTDQEKAVAVSRFRFNGIPVDEYTQLPVDPSYRISTFDTNDQGWDEETKEWAEGFLMNHPQHGSDFVLVEIAKRQAPWQGYDSLAADRVVDLVTATGSDVEDVIAYEKENKNRKTLISALEELLTPSEGEVVVSA